MHGAGSICLVANELANLGRTGGIGSSNWELAHLLAADGWRTHVLYTQTGDETAALDRIRKQLSCAGIGFTALDEVPLSPETSLPGWPFIDELDVSERVCEALPQLDRTHCFDLIQFADWQGVGFRTIQAKQAGLILPNARIIVCSHGMSAWARDAAGRWPSADDLLLEHAEQQTFEMADFQVAPTQYILDYARSIGWNVRDDAQVVRNPLPTPISNTQHISANISDTLPQLVFFGRLDRHKGLILILEALREVDPAIPISFLGRDTVLADGRIAMELIHRQLIGRKIEFHTDMGREEAIRYLSGANRLALIPSIMENYPNTVLECAANGIPFLASRVGGIPEIVKDPQLNLALLFEPTKADLCRSLKNWLELTPSARQDICNRLRNDLSTETHNSEIAKSYRGFLETGADCSVNSSRTPLVSIAVTYFNLGRFLPETLRSLARQTYSQCEILILNDGSTDPASQRIFAEQEKLYPKFRFIHQTNTGLCGARNKLLEEARGEYFLPCDADDIAAPDLVERLVIALERCQNLSASAVYYLGFHDASGSVSANDISAKDTSTNGIRANDTSANDNRTNDISANATTAERSFAWAYRPTGGPLLIGGQANCWGGPSTMYRTEVLRSIGGYRDHQNCNIEDWHLHAKLASLGHKIGVVPRPLIFYRERPESMFRTVDQYTGHRFVMNDALLSTPLTANQLRDLWGTLALSGQHSDRLWGQAKSEKKHSEVLLEQLREAHQQMTQLHDQIAQLSRDNAKMTERCIEQQNHDDEEVEDVECLHNQSNLVPANDSMKSPRIWNLFARRSQLRNPILRHKTELPTSAKQKKQTAPLLFLHVRKAGGTSLLHFLINQFPADSILDQASIEARQRDNLSRYRFVAGHVSASIVANFDQAPQLITCIRDPIERILSEFAYCRSHGPVEIAALPNYDWSPDEIKGFRGVCEKMRAGDLRSFLDREPILAQSWFGNMMTRQLVGLPLFSPVEPTLEDLELACRTLRRCAHFSLTHKMYESFWLLTRRFGWAMPESVPHANVSRKRLATADLDETTLARLRMLTRIDSQLFEYAQQLFNERLQEAGFSEGAERQDVDVSLLEEPHDFCFDQPIRGSGWHARERDQHGWFAWSGPDCDAWLDLSRPPSSNRRLLCSVRHAASSEILNATRLTINGHHVKHKFKANGPEVILIADFNKSHLQANQERVRIGISVPATITPDSGFVEERRLGVAVSRIAFVRR